MSYFDFYEELTAEQQQGLQRLMSIHEKAGMRPYDAAMQALRDKIAETNENRAEIEALISEAAISSIGVTSSVVGIISQSSRMLMERMGITITSRIVNMIAGKARFATDDYTQKTLRLTARDLPMVKQAIEYPTEVLPSGAGKDKILLVYEKLDAKYLTMVEVALTDRGNEVTAVWKLDQANSDRRLLPYRQGRISMIQATLAPVVAIAVADEERSDTVESGVVLEGAKSSGDVSGLKVTAPNYARQNFDYRNDVGAAGLVDDSTLPLPPDATKPVFEAAYNWQQAIADAETFEDITAVFDRMFPKKLALLDKPPIAITKIDNASFTNPDLKRAASDSLQAMRASFALLPGGIVINNDSGISIASSNKMTNHAMHLKHPHIREHIEVAPFIPELLQKAVLAETYDDKKDGNPNLKIHRMYAPFAVKDKLFRVKMTVQELKKSTDKSDTWTRFYDHSLTELEEIKSPATESTDTTLESEAHSQHFAGLNDLTISDLLKGARKNDGTLFVPEDTNNLASKGITTDTNIDGKVIELKGNGRVARLRKSGVWQVYEKEELYDTAKDTGEAVEMLLESAVKYDWRSSIERATSFDEITAVFDRMFPKVDSLRHLPFDTLTNEQQAAIRAEVARQKAAVVLIKDSEGRLLSPNGKVSKLNEEQYRTVRTPWFKEWAGDWEAVYAVKKLNAMQPLILDGLQVLTDKKDIEGAFRNFKPSVNQQDGREVVFPVSMAGKISRHKGFDVKRIASGFDRLFAESVRMASEPEQAKVGHKVHPEISAYHQYVSKFEQEGVEYYVRFTVQEMKAKTGQSGKNIAHSSFVSEISIYTQGAEPVAGGRVIDPVFAEVVAPVDSKLAQWLTDGNKNSVTKVVDPETGEPMVVYHGTGSDFDTYSGGNEGVGNHFGSKDQASQVAKLRWGDNKQVVPSYLSIKNPVRLMDMGHWDADEDVVPQLVASGALPSGYSYDGKALDLLQGLGYDGVVYLNRREGLPAFANDVSVREKLNEMTDEEVLKVFPDVQDSWIAFSSPQIKSSIGNLGTFSPEKGSIVESIPQDKIFDNIKAVETLVNRAKSFDDIAKIFKVLYGLGNGGQENDRTDTADNSGIESSNTGTAQGRSELPDSRADGAYTGVGIPPENAGGNGAKDSLAQQAEGSERKPPRAGDVFDGSIAIGRKQKLYTAQMNAIEANYAIVEASTLVVSNSFDGKINPDYPKEIQPRNRTKSSSQLQIQKIANNIVPELMGLSAKASDGAPIIGDDGVVESGNGRTIALKLAYSTGKGAEYRQWLIDEAAVFGIEASKVESMKQPVLVRIRKTPVDRAQFAREANQADISAMSPAELAQADAERLSDNDLELLNLSEGETILGNSNKPFIKSFLATLGTNEAAGYLDSKGRATRQLGDRAQAAIFAMAYDDEKLISLMSEESDGDIKNIISGLTMSALSFAKMDKEEADKAEINIIPDVLAAVEFIRSAKSRGLTLNDFLAQQDFFTARNETAEAIALYLESIKRSAKKVGTFFSIMARGVQNDLDGRGGMFGDELRSKQQIIDAAKKVGINESATTATAVMFKNGNFTRQFER